MRARLLLLAGALAAFGGSLFAGFHLDDYAIFPAVALRALGWPHPLTHFLDWLNLQIAGQAATGYHAVNWILQATAVLLAYECMRRILPARGALIAAAIFAVHPLQAEVVDYVAARGAIVLAICCLAALWAWLAGQRIAAFAIALAAVMEAVPPTLSAMHGMRSWRLFVLPWGFTIASEVQELWWLTLIAALGIVAWRWGRPEIPWLAAGMALSLAGSWTYLAVFTWAAAAGLMLERCDRRVAVALVSVLGLLSVHRTYVWMSEERLWREAVAAAPQQAEPKIELAKYVRAAEALELLGRARQEAPYNPEIPAQTGKILLDEQQFQSAVEDLSRAVAMNPSNALAFNNRGVALAALGQSAAAEADFQQALRLDPQFQEARENLKRLTGK